MNNFIIENDFLVLNKIVKQSKSDENGNKKNYGLISLYCKETDEFQKITIFENYNEILNKYDVMKYYKIKLQVSIITKDGKTNTYIKFV